MTATPETLNNQPQYSPVIKELQAAIAVDPKDIITKLNLASQLEEEGFKAEAAVVYRDIVASDEEGVFAASAEQALQAIALELGLEPGQDWSQPKNAPPAPMDEPATPPETPEPVLIQTTPMGEATKIPDNPNYSETIETLRAEVEHNPDDIVAQISLASALESEGFLTEAAMVYRDIIANDVDGVFSASAAKALQEIEKSLVPQIAPSPETEEPVLSILQEAARVRPAVLVDEAEDSAGLSPVLKGIRDLPIAKKQFFGMLLSSLVTLTGVVGTGIAITNSSGQRQLVQQASSELAVSEIEYDIKIDQMGFGFRGQSDNVAVIAAAAEYAQSKTVKPELQEQVKGILKNEITARNIEFATLVGADKRIIISANAERTGEIFDPNGLVSQAIAAGRQIKASELISWADIEKEDPPLPIGTPKGEAALIRYTVTPVEAANGTIVGVLVSGDVVVKGKAAIAIDTVEAFDGGYSAVYQLNEDNSFTLSAAASREVGNDPTATENVIRTSFESPELLSLPNKGILKEAIAADGNIVTDSQIVGGVTYSLAAYSIRNAAGQPIAVLVRGTPVEELNVLLRNSFLLQAGIGLFAVAISAVLAGLLGRAISRPIRELQETAEDFGQGNFEVRAKVGSADEIGRLAATFNKMAGEIIASTEVVAQQSRQNEKEAEFQRKERERLQESVIRLLLQIEEARRGDLKVQAEVDEGEVGSIADAFNATMRSLRALVSQVKTSANEVYGSAIANNELITKLAEEATVQERAIQSAEKSVQGIAQSIQSVAKSAQVAAKIARASRLAAQQGQETMDETVENIDTIRSSVADTSKKAKRLAESSQEISKIVSIISDISEKTNLLAFNASIEATRAGENGQGFRVVADEVRRLAEQVTSSAQEIEQVIGGIQEETVQMMRMMEESTSQVVTGTELVRKTKITLQNVARISEEIDKVLNSISKATVSQQDASTKVTKTMQSVAQVAQKTASESRTMSQKLDALTKVAVGLQESSSKFKVD